MWSSTLVDDLGYVQQSPDEAEVLFTLLAERYERRSVNGDEQPGLQPVGPDIPRPDGHGGGDRPLGPPCGRARVRRAELPNGPVPPAIAVGACPSRTCSRSAVAPSPPTLDVVNVRPIPGTVAFPLVRYVTV